jgi:hypothetical protein
MLLSLIKDELIFYVSETFFFSDAFFMLLDLYTGYFMALPTCIILHTKPTYGDRPQIDARPLNSTMT